MADSSQYIDPMRDRETINGEPVTEEAIEQWVAEAEAGYDVPTLKMRGRGRQGPGVLPTQSGAVRFATDDVGAVDRLAEREGES